MNLTDKKYQTLSVMGIVLCMSSLFLTKYIPNELSFALVGFSAGWIAAVWLLKFLILKEERKTLSNKSKQILNELTEMTKPTK